MRRRLVLLCGAAAYALACLPFVSAARADDWESYQHDPQHSGMSATGPNPTTLRLSWQAPTGFSTPLIVGNAVFGLANGQGENKPTTLASFNLTTGVENWSAAATYVFPSQEVYGGGLVAFVGKASGASQSYLHVFNASTGAAAYTVPVSTGSLAELTEAADPTTGQPVVYATDGNHVTAVRLGATSGTVLWSDTSSLSSAMPSVIGGDLLFAAPQNSFAVNRSTGAVTHFYIGDGSGGGGNSPAVDAARSQFYVTQDYGSVHALTAYRMTGSTITKLWQGTGTGINNSNGVAIGPDGSVYSADGSTLVQLNSSTGAIIRSVAGNFALGGAPETSDGYVWDYGGGEGSSLLTGDTVAYRLSDLTLAGDVPGTRGDSNSDYASGGAMDDTHYIVDYGNIYGSPGFAVYAGSPVPEPTMAAPLVAGAALAAGRRKPRVRSQSAS